MGREMFRHAVRLKLLKSERERWAGTKLPVRPKGSKFGRDGGDWQTTQGVLVVA